MPDFRPCETAVLRNGQPGLAIAAENGHVQVIFRPELQLIALLHNPEPRLLAGIETCAMGELEIPERQPDEDALRLSSQGPALEQFCSRSPCPAAAHRAAFQTLRELAAIEALRKHPDGGRKAQEDYADQTRRYHPPGTSPKEPVQPGQLAVRWRTVQELPLRHPEPKPSTGLSWLEPDAVARAGDPPEPGLQAAHPEGLRHFAKQAARAAAQRIHLFAKRSLGESIPRKGLLHPPILAPILALRLAEIRTQARTP